MLCDLWLFVILSSPSSGPRKESGRLIRSATVGKVPPLSLPGPVCGPGWPQPSCEAVGFGWCLAGQGPFREPLGPAGRAEPSARKGALLHRARLPCVPSQGQCVQAAGGAGQRPTELQPRPHSRCGPRSATRSEESRGRAARCPTPWLAFSHSPIVWIGVGTEWGRGLELANAGDRSFSCDLETSLSLLVFYFFILRRGILEDAHEIVLPVKMLQEMQSPNRKIFIECHPLLSQSVCPAPHSGGNHFSHFPPVFSGFFLHTSR